jgi:hypothetical protein
VDRRKIKKGPRNGLIVGGWLEIHPQHSANIGEGLALGGRQAIGLDKSCESMADLQKRLDFCSYDRRFHGSIQFMHAAIADIEGPFLLYRIFGI